MKIAYNPSGASPLAGAPKNNNDIIFDLAGKAIYVKDVKLLGTDTVYDVFKKHTSSNGGGNVGLVPVPSYTNTNTRFLREDGTWVVPTNTTYEVFTGSNLENSGKAGLVPAPLAGFQKLLQSDGTWTLKFLFYDIPANSAIKITFYSQTHATIFMRHTWENNMGVYHVSGYGSYGDTKRISIVEVINSCSGIIYPVDGEFAVIIKNPETTNRLFVSATLLLGSIRKIETVTSEVTKSDIWRNVLHSDNAFIKNGTININGVSITPLTQHQSLSNYVTLNSSQTISGAKTFTQALVTNSYVEGTKLRFITNSSSQGNYLYILNSSCYTAQSSPTTHDFIVKTGLPISANRKYYLELKGDLYSGGNTFNLIISFFMYNSNIHEFRVAGFTTYPTSTHIATYIENNIEKIAIYVENGTSHNILQHFITLNLYKHSKDDPDFTIINATTSDINSLTIKSSINNTSNLYLGNINTSKIKLIGGTSSQFLKGDGSVDSNTYATTTLLGLYLPLTGGTLTGDLNFGHLNSVVKGHITWTGGTILQRIQISDNNSTNDAVFAFLLSTNSGTDWTDLFTIKDNGYVIATSFIGNIDGTYVNKLTGYKIATTRGAVAATDSLNTALGKLEYKAYLGVTAYDWYKSITNDDTDDIINKWGEIVGFLDSVKEGTDILDEFVTRKTDLVITGKKTFYGDGSTLLTVKRNHESHPTYIHFADENESLGFIGISKDHKPVFHHEQQYTILHAGNSYINNGVITINGTSITPLTSHQSLSNYVTLNTYLKITGLKLFNTSSNTIPLLIARGGNNESEVLKIGIDDHDATFEYVNDEISNSFVFKLVNTDAEVSDGSNANSSLVKFYGGSDGSTVIADNFIGNLNKTLTFAAGAFTAKTYNNSSAVTVNVPTKTSHLTNDSGYLTSRGYIGKTAVQASSAIQNLTGIGSASFSGVVTISTSIKNHTSPTEQCLVINSDAVPDGTTVSLKNSPGIGFHISLHSWGSLVFNGTFNFINDDATSFMPVKASKFITNGGTSSLFVKGDGSLDSNTYLTSHLSLANYVTLNTAQTITGAKTFTRIIYGNAYNYNENKAGAYLVLNKGGNYLGIGASSSNIQDIVIGESDLSGTWIKEHVTIDTSGHVKATKFIGISKLGDWYSGRDRATFKTTGYSGGYSPTLSIKTTNGSWELGTYDASSFIDNLIFSYVTDTDYNSDINQNVQIKLPYTKSGIIALTSDITKAAVGLGNVLNTAFYARTATVNGTAWDMAGTKSGATFSIYSPTTAGTSGLILVSNGSGAPVWKTATLLTVGTALKLLSGGGNNLGQTSLIYYKFASYTSEDITLQINLNAFFYVTQYYNSHNFGLLRVEVRFNNNGTSPVTGNFRIEWLVNSGIDPNSVQMSYLVSGNTRTINIYHKLTTYHWDSFKVIKLSDGAWSDESGTDWELHRDVKLTSLPTDEIFTKSVNVAIANTAAPVEYGLLNLCVRVAAGNLTSVTNNVLTTSGVNADTWFKLILSEPLEVDLYYTLGFYVENVPLSATLWSFGVGKQSNTNWVINITSNGWVWATGYYNGNGNSLELLIDDYSRNFYDSIKISKIVLVKGKLKAYYSPAPINLSNYTSYLGYIGTTKVQASSTAQALTGITSATISGVTTTNTLTISNTSGTGHINFSRGSCNYITMPSGGLLHILPNGVGVSASNGMVFSYNGLHPASNSAYSLGTSSLRWNLVYAHELVSASCQSNFIALNSSGRLSNYGGFIDFHFRNSEGKPTDNLGNVVETTPDYTSRIIENAAGTLSINGATFKNGYVTSVGFIKSNSSDSYILLGGGSHKAVSDFLLKSELGNLELNSNLCKKDISLKPTTLWADVGDLGTLFTNPHPGTYAILVYCPPHKEGTTNRYHVYYSGIMSINDNTNTTNTSDEIWLHASAHASHIRIYLRTITLTGAKYPKLLIAASANFAEAVTFNFKIKRLI